MTTPLGDAIYCFGFCYFKLGDSSMFTTVAELSDTFQKQQQQVIMVTGALANGYICITPLA